jgi:signal peptidase I
MFDLNGKNQHRFGLIEPSDDPGIEVRELQRESRADFWKIFFSESFKLVRDVFLIILIFILAAVFIVQPVVVEGTSMVPQLQDGERLLVNKLIYYKIKSFEWGHINRGDIVVFWFPNEPDKSYVKRVIGLPGETVEVTEGKVYIDGRELEEKYVETDFNQVMSSFPPRRVEDHFYFVMGDNRDNSSDSRYWGLVPEKYIYGKAFFRYWKPNKAGMIHHGEYADSAAPRVAPSPSPEEGETSDR